MALAGLAGKTAIVTGAAGGIGSATVTRLLEEGCNVVAVDLDAAKVRSACAGANDTDFLALAADVSSEQDCQKYVQQTVARFGGVDLFVNNAGVLGKRMRLVDMPVAEFDRVMSVNLRGVFLGLQAVIRAMLAQGKGGAIVNTSSIGAIRSVATSAAYGTSKNAVLSLTRVAALEYGKDKIRVNTVCPGFTDTPMLAEAQGAALRDIVARHPLGRMAQPVEIASMIAYLLSDEASFQTGGMYTVDGAASLV
jgi:NAD(P)-dependent dehydrogenase (short-subunit alcohol dehydrogenase family)